ncbi:MAG TPA: FtsX-like permease family protein, partial [Vicinamibacterales bacterium]|nr:FtsX-like permease family protein [Vicinamibacterales bacterium]
IVGVMPPDAEYPRGVEAWCSITAFAPTLTNPAFRVDVDLIARVRRGTTITQAAGELRALVAQLDKAAPAGSPASRTAVVRSFARVVVGDVQTAMLILFGAVALVLLIASTNVANLLLLRGAARREEFAVRAALGASRSQLARGLVAESVLLALAGGIVGLAVVWWALQGVAALVPGGLPRVESIRIDSHVILFSVAIAFLVAAVTGTAPALFAARTDVAGQLRSGAQGHTGAVVRRGQRALVVLQVALAVTVVVVAGLLTRSLWLLQSVDMGLISDRIVFVDLALPQAKYADGERHLRFLKEIVTQLQAAPQIAEVTPVNVKPFAGTAGWDVSAFTAEGQSAERAATNPSLNLESVDPNYFETFQVPLVRGRTFTDADRAGAPSVAVVSEDVAARTWPGKDPIGKRIKFGRIDSTDHWREVVGVVKPTRYRELVAPRATLYVPAEQFIVAAHTLALRTTAPIAQVATLVHNRVRLIDDDVHVMRVMSFADILNGPLARSRFNALMIAIFATGALLLAGVGLYAIMAAYVRQRTTEIGIRVALGATPADIRRLVISEAMRLVGTGAAAGLATAVAVTRVVQSLLFKVAPLDPISIVTAMLILLAASAVASYLPVRRASRVDPIALLKTV